MANETVLAAGGIFPHELTPDLVLILDSIPDGVYGVDGDGRVALVNRAAAQMLGYEPQGLIGAFPHDVMHHTRPDGTPYPADECPLHTVTSEQRPHHADEDVFWRRDGSRFPVEYDSQPLVRNGQFAGFVVTFRDITLRLKHEDRVRDLLREQFARAKAEFQHAQLREVLAQTPAVIAVTRGPRHLIEMVNDRYRAFIGNRDVVGQPIREAFPHHDPAQLALMDIAFETGEAQVSTEITRDVRVGDSTEPHVFNYVYQPLRDESGFVYGLMKHGIDITREVHGRRAVENQNRRALLTASVGVSVTKPQSLRNTLRECSEALVAHLDAAFAGVWTARPAEQILELEASAGMDTQVDGPPERVPVGQFEIGLIAHERRAHLTNDVANDLRMGERAWAVREGIQACAGYPLLVGEELVGVLAMFSRRQLEEADLRALETVAHVLALGIQRRRAEDSLGARADELARFAARLALTNRELDAFAYAASHDLRAPLRGIANLAQWIEEDLTNDGSLKSETREMLELMRSRMHRMEALIEGILQYSRAGRIQERAVRVDTRAMVAEVVELLSIPPHVTVDLDASLPVIESVAPPLQQIFMNLIANAVKHNDSPDARIWISARDAGEFVEFSVRDNGRGIAPEFHERIWGIFQTLESRDKVEGTGIGLSLVKKLVVGQGGRAWVESAPAQGATFRFFWPKRPGAAQRSE